MPTKWHCTSLPTLDLDIDLQGLECYDVMANKMPRPNRDGDIGEARPARQRQARPPANEASPPYPQPPHAAMYNLNGTSYFPHPCGYHGKSDEDCPGNSDGASRKAKPKSPPRPGGAKERHPTATARATPGNGTKASVNAELKVSLAAKQLASQISDSKKLWIAFQEKFEKEVTGIKHYISDDTLRQIWQKRIDYNRKYKDSESQSDEEFGIQRMKLETCLDQLSEAAKAFVRIQPLNGRTDHDPRHLALDKIRTAGTLVLGLAAKSALNSAACADLVREASNLEKLVDPRSPDARILHRFDRRETKKPTPEEENVDPMSFEGAPQEAEDMFNQVVIEQEEMGKKERDGWD
ncbi:hypothetical protein F4677DRAFT_422814 [Hypoxylon crocopeplum]|nr:hypothetical protein F4677DRAFT_422814 [Hypoxylon crocopeplum]